MAKIKESELKTVLVELPTDMQIAFNKDATNPTMSLVIDLLNAIKMQTIANKAVELLGGITRPKPYITIEELEKERYHLKIQCIENSDYHIDYISGLKDLFKVAAKIAKERK